MFDRCGAVLSFQICVGVALFFRPWSAWRLFMQVSNRDAILLFIWIARVGAKPLLSSHRSARRLLELLICDSTKLAGCVPRPFSCRQDAVFLFDAHRAYYCNISPSILLNIIAIIAQHIGAGWIMFHTHWQSAVTFVPPVDICVYSHPLIAK